MVLDLGMEGLAWIVWVDSGDSHKVDMEGPHQRRGQKS